MTEEHGAQEIYQPSPEVIAAANVKSYEELARDANEDLAGFWAEQAERIDWFQPFTKVRDVSFEGDVRIQWYEDGVLNEFDNCPLTVNTGQDDLDGDGAI